MTVNVTDRKAKDNAAEYLRQWSDRLSAALCGDVKKLPRATQGIVTRWRRALKEFDEKWGMR